MHTRMGWYAGALAQRSLQVGVLGRECLLQSVVERVGVCHRELLGVGSDYEGIQESIVWISNTRASWKILYMLRSRCIVDVISSNGHL